MSRYQSIYATQQNGPSRWPWVIVALVVIALAAGTGAMIAQGETPRSLLDRVDSNAPHNTPQSELALRPDATSTAATDSGPKPTASAAAANTPAPTKSAAKPTATAKPADSANSPAAGAAASPAEAAVVDPTSPNDVVDAYAARWNAGDYGGLYDLLTTQAQGTIKRQDFIDRYNAIAQEAGLTSVKMTATGDFDLNTSVPVSIEYKSSKVGTIKQDNTVQLAKDGDDWKIAWTPSLIFTDLNDGCVDFCSIPPPRQHPRPQWQSAGLRRHGQRGRHHSRPDRERIGRRPSLARSSA